MNENDEYQPTLFASMCRRTCSQCAAGLKWYPLGEAFDTLGATVVGDLMSQAPEGLSPERDEVEFWQCRACREVGMLISPNDLLDRVHEPPAVLCARGLQPGGRRASGAAPGTRRGRFHP
jgi:hypothetical protein